MLWNRKNSVYLLLKNLKKLGNGHRSKNLFAHSLLKVKNIFWFPLLNPQDTSRCLSTISSYTLVSPEFCHLSALHLKVTLTFNCLTFPTVRIHQGCKRLSRKAAGVLMLIMFHVFSWGPSPNSESQRPVWAIWNRSLPHSATFTPRWAPWARGAFLFLI